MADRPTLRERLMRFAPDDDNPSVIEFMDLVREIRAIEAEAASPAALDVERARRAFEIHDMEHHGIGGLHPESCDEWIAAEYARLSPSEGSGCTRARHDEHCADLHWESGR